MAVGDIGRAMAKPACEYDDIQGILRSGYARLGEACFLQLRIIDPARAKAWIAAIIEEPGVAKLPYRVTHAGDSQIGRAHV